MGNLFKILAFVVDIAKGLGNVVKNLQKQNRIKKDEKEQSDLEKIINSDNNSK